MCLVAFSALSYLRVLFAKVWRYDTFDDVMPSAV